YAVRRGAAASGQHRRRSLQPGGFPDAVEMGRAGTRPVADPGTRARRVRPLRDGASQYLHQRSDGAARDVADAPATRSVFCWPDFRCRGLRRVGGVGTDCRPQCRLNRARRGAAGTAADDGDRCAGVLRLARRSAQLSADEHHVRDHAATRSSRWPTPTEARRTQDGHFGACVARPRGVDRPGVDAMTKQLREFLEYLRLNRNASAHTSAAYESDITQFLGFAAPLRSLPVEALEPSHLDLGAIRAFMADLYRQGHARTSVARKLSALRAFSRYLRREGWIENDPAALAVGPKREQKIPAHLSEDEMSRLLEMPDVSTALGRRDRAILELFYASGLRLSELVSLDLENINLRARMVRVMGKGAKERLVPFNSTTEDSIRVWLADRNSLR